MKELFSRVKDPFQKEDGLSLVERVFLVALFVGGIAVFLASATYVQSRRASSSVSGPFYHYSTQISTVTS